MEAKVDIRKLQVLSDRINQATEALNSVRASVHGLGHTTATSPYGSFGYGIGMQQPMGTMGYGTFNQPFMQGQFSQGQFPQGQFSPYTTGFVPGLQHTTAMGQLPYNVSQFSQFPQQMGGYGYGYGAQQQMIPGLQSQVSPWQTQYSPMMGQFGLQHTTAGQQLGNVPQQTMNVPYGLGTQQTFPFGVGLQHTSAAAQVPVWGSMSQIPSMQQNVMGLSPEIMEQRALEARANDPYRLAQTFPFAFQAQAPVGIW
jgi:hypothetical protein